MHPRSRARLSPKSERHPRQRPVLAQARPRPQQGFLALEDADELIEGEGGFAFVESHSMMLARRLGYRPQGDWGVQAFSPDGVSI